MLLSQKLIGRKVWGENDLRTPRRDEDAVGRPAENLFVVPGLGSCTWDAFAAGDDDRNYYLWGAMGGAAMIGLGLALAKPISGSWVVTGDGEMLMAWAAIRN